MKSASPAITRDSWLARHPYLRPMAHFQAEVDLEASALELSRASVPDWEEYREEFRAGTPWLISSTTQIDLLAVERAVAELAQKLATKPFPPNLTEQSRGLASELRRDGEPPARACASLLGRAEFASTHPGMLRYLGWTVLTRFLTSVVVAFAKWRDEEHWLRGYCPTCGSLPSMGQLIGKDPGRLRLLCCGCCGTSWRFGRTACPFCQHSDSHRLASLLVEGEAGLRIDHCEFCGGYLKTYDGQGQEHLLLSDWSSFHLDVLAQQRGWKRMASSLYQF